VEALDGGGDGDVDGAGDLACFEELVGFADVLFSPGKTYNCQFKCFEKDKRA
jgi:hypothetical protein